MGAGSPPPTSPWGSIGYDDAKQWKAIAGPAYEGVTSLLLDAADLRPGLRVLDLGCGTGSPALEAAPRLLPGGRVVGIDPSPNSIVLAQRFASESGIGSVEFRNADAEQLPFADASFDRVTSRFAPMFFRDLNRAVTESVRVLRPGGRLAWMVWGRIDDQPFFDATVKVALRYSGLDELPAESRQPFCFGDGGQLASALSKGGLLEVSETRHSVPVIWPTTPENLSQSFWKVVAPPFQPVVNRLTAEQREKAEAESVELLQRSYREGRVQLSASVIVGIGTKADASSPTELAATAERLRESLAETGQYLLSHPA